jgi:restriction system protein
MWRFAGTINFQCAECGEIGSVDIADFDVECVGGDERGMGPESIYELVWDTECNECDNEISFKFTASEYPVELLSYVDSDVTGATTADEPYIEYLPDELYEVQHFDLAKATTIEIIREIQADKNVLREITPRQFEELVA